MDSKINTKQDKDDTDEYTRSYFWVQRLSRLYTEISRMYLKEHTQTLSQAHTNFTAL